MARPGPLIYAEFDGLGLPLWLGDRYPETVVVRRDGRREQGAFFWSHSLGQPVYRAKVRAWYEAISAFLTPYWNDPVISFQLDNETGLLFANQVGRIDFNPDTIVRFRHWLEGEHGSIDAMNTVWGTHLGSFAEVLPPRPPLRQPQIDDWQRFLEAWIDDYLHFLSETARACGVPVPLVHNEQGIQHSPVHQVDGKPTFDFVGYDVYPKASSGKETADFPFVTSLFPGIFSAYRTPERPMLATELGTGWFDPRAKVSDAVVAQTIFASIAHGARGLCLFTMHDGREPTGEPYNFGAPLDEFGRITPRYRVVAEIGTFLERWGDDLLAHGGDPGRGRVRHVLPELPLRRRGLLPRAPTSSTRTATSRSSRTAACTRSSCAPASTRRSSTCASCTPSRSPSCRCCSTPRRA